MVDERDDRHEEAVGYLLARHVRERSLDREEGPQC